jgi:hypothetical protein
MGSAYTLSCGNCSYKQNVFLGIGFRYIDLSSILEWYEEEPGLQQIREFMKFKDTTYDCFDGLYVCQECGYLSNKVYLYLSSEIEKRTYINGYTCPCCNTQMPLKPLIDIDEKLECPDCKRDKLDVKLYMDWD